MCEITKQILREEAKKQETRKSKKRFERDVLFAGAFDRFFLPQMKTISK